MVAPSKIYQNPLNRVHCSQLLHSGKTCTEFCLENMYRCFISSSKYFLPLLMPIVLKARTNDLHAIYEQVKNYIQTVGVATLVASTIFYLICLLRNFNGRFTKYCTLFIPTFFGSLICILTPPKVLRLFSIATSQAAIEALLRQHSNILSRLLLNSKLVQTLLFMANSAVILHLKRLKEYGGFWFIQPINPIKNENVTEPTATRPEVICNSKCMHSDKSCKRFIWEGIRSYLPYGILLDMLSALSKSKTPKSFKEVFRRLRTTRWNMTGFFVFYAGVYRLTSCLVAKYLTNSSANLQHLLAAFLSGAAYIFLGKVTFLTLSLIIATQISWQHFCSKRILKNTDDSTKPKKETFLNGLRAVPFSKVFMPLNTAYLVHCYVYHHHVVNSLGKGFINALTNNITQRLYNYLTNHDMEHLMNEIFTESVMKVI